MSNWILFFAVWAVTIPLGRYLSNKVWGSDKGKAILARIEGRDRS